MSKTTTLNDLWTGPATATVPYSQNAAGTFDPTSSANPLATHDARPPCSDALFATSGSGAATALPASAGTVELTAVSADLWFRFGSAGLGTVSAPNANMSSGAPRFLPQGAAILVDVHTATQYAVASQGSYTLAWWL